MIHYRTKAMRQHDAAAWAALVSGAADLTANPLPEETSCVWPECDCPRSAVCPECPLAEGSIPCLWPRWGCKHGYGESCRNCESDPWEAE
jgi:hypothetical protein